MAKMRMKKAFEDYMTSYDDFVKQRSDEYDAALEEYGSIKESSKPSLHTDKKLDKIESTLTSLRTHTNHEKEYPLKKGVSVKMRTSMDFDCVSVYPNIMKTGDNYASRGEIDLRERDSEIRTILKNNGFLMKGVDSSSFGNKIYTMRFANYKGDAIEVGYDILLIPKDKKYSALAQELVKIYTDKKRPTKRNEGSFVIGSGDIEDVIQKTESKIGPDGSEKGETTHSDLIDMAKEVYETEIKDKIDEADKAVSDMIKKGELDESLGGFMGMFKEVLDMQMDLLESEKKGKKKEKK